MTYCVLMIMVTVMVERTMPTVAALYVGCYVLRAMLGTFHSVALGI